MRTERFATALVIGVLIGLLVIATGAARRADREATWALEQVKTDLSVIQSLRDANETLKTRLDQPPVERIVTVQAPCREDVGHETPIFSRDSVVLAGH